MTGMQVSGQPIRTRWLPGPSEL